MKFMKISLIVTLAVTLVACSPASTQSPNATLTSLPTSTPTLAPTPTETPAPTKDSNAPDEFTRFENGMYYMDLKTEKGNTLTYTWDKERNTWERMLFSGYLVDYSQKDINDGMQQPDQLLTTVYLDQSIEGEMLMPTLSHIPNTDAWNKVNFSSNIYTDMLQALKNRGNISDIKEFTFSNWNEGKFYLEFTNADGPQRWGLWPESTITVHIRGDFEQLKANTDTNGFSEAKWNSSYGPKNSYMVKIWTKDGNLIVHIAPSLRPASRWTEKQILEMIFFGPADVMESTDLVHPGSGTMLSGYVLNAKTLPYFTFGPPP